ncbi:FAD-binding domain-containing protein, partial [Haematococcus lacustris]
MLLAVSSFEQVTKVLAVARTRLGEVLSAFEFLDAESMHMVCSHAQQGVVNPLKPQPEWPVSPFYVLLETHGSCEAHDREKLEGLSEVILESGDALDAVVARDSSRTAAVWRVRE